MAIATAPSDSMKRLAGTTVSRLDGALIVQHGHPMLITAASAQDVVRHAAVDILDAKHGQGYQREPSNARIRAAAQYYAQGGRIPNPLLINIREEDFDRVRVVPTGQDRAGYDQAIEDGGEWIGIGYIEIPKDLKMWVYDGQHRGGGIEQLLDENAAFGNFPVPLSITLGLTTLQEMREFYDVNTNAKSVKTDLAWELLRKMSETDPELADVLEVSGKDWMTRGGDVVRALQELDGPWKESIQLPNVKKTKSDRLTMGQAEFIRSIKGVLDLPLLQKADPSLIAQIINAYWQGIAVVLPKPFASDTSPKDWVIQKGAGTFGLHRVLPRVIEILRSRGKRLGDPMGYAEVMKGLQFLSGEVLDEETDQPVTVEGAEFWAAGPRGVASAFTGEAGRKRLFVRIQALLPKPTEEFTL